MKKRDTLLKPAENCEIMTIKEWNKKWRKMKRDMYKEMRKNRVKIRKK